MGGLINGLIISSTRNLGHENVVKCKLSVVVYSGRHRLRFGFDIVPKFHEHLDEFFPVLLVLFDDTILDVPRIYSGPLIRYFVIKENDHGT
jgi:hypothetical protein